MTFAKPSSTKSQLVEETDILKSINLILQEEHLLIEGAAGLAVAAFLKLGQEGMYRDKTVVIVLVGAMWIWKSSNS
ncbi:MAG: hypothetical protein R2865_09315 [Deinococcales bacterium]